MELIDFGYSLLWEKKGLQVNSPTISSGNCKWRLALLVLDESSKLALSQLDDCKGY